MLRNPLANGRRSMSYSDAPQFDRDGKKIAHAVIVKVTHNGRVVHENVELSGPTRGGQPEKAVGPLRLQGDHGPVAFRNIRILRRKLLISGLLRVHQFDVGSLRVFAIQPPRIVRESVLVRPSAALCS